MLFNRFALTTIRELRFVSKAELVAPAEVSPAYLTELEKGNRRFPSERIVRQLAEALEVRPEALAVPREQIRQWVLANETEVRAWLVEENAEVAEAVAL